LNCGDRLLGNSFTAGMRCGDAKKGPQKGAQKSQLQRKSAPFFCLKHEFLNAFKNSFKNLPKFSLRARHMAR